MVSERCYRPGMPEAAARAELLRCAGTQFDPVVVDAFLTALETSEGELAAEPTLAEAA
jgi:HD-GYP domain-containing protein (c-di-GMP phosphodiesterase class II)